jgi:hypothetical protein
MGKNKKNQKLSKDEEKRADRVVKLVFVSLVALAIVMLIGFSFIG